MLPHRQRLGTIILFLSDVVILFFIAVLTIFMRTILPGIVPGLSEFAGDPLQGWWFFPVWMAILLSEGAYTKRFTFWDEVKLLWKVSLFSTLAVLTIVFLSKMSESYSRALVLFMGALSLCVFPVMRLTAKRLLIRIGLLKSRVLILGANETGQRALVALRKEPNLGYEVVGFIDDDRSKQNRTIEGKKIHGYLHQVERYLSQADIQDIVIALPENDKEQLSRLVNRLQHKTRSILYIPDFSGMAVIGTELRHFFHDQMFALEIKNNLAQPINYFAKRLFDYVVGFTLFLLLILPLLAIAALIALTSKGPAIFRQRRVGKNCKPFLCFKFRTMYFDAEERLKTILASDPEAKAEWERYRKLKDDPRITTIGSFLRKTSLDELPQIFNVLQGEMSLVGPRPVTHEEIVMYYKDAAELCFGVLPGITGFWQVSGRSNTSYDYRISLDSWYVRNWNLWLDIVIMMKTAYVVFKKDGAR